MRPRYPSIGAGALAIFLLASGVMLHDFWAVDGADADDEMTHFLENRFGSGAALTYVAISRFRGRTRSISASDTEYCTDVPAQPPPGSRLGRN
ncbi:hypothetical protein D8Y22_22195 [Salinadaptatus halalkaliphilus]|uniref:Uncharacterized protein n=1 Tax=Salinadaptatus halalkaliphilus TaxID=2419781 RepID=A0A4S3TJL6_9EURY|nr:hypothetical protein [Salinadaptatus halalkaliphilus]THE62778.1 hypothetical protein D8Y22_22195 [Salinadaptatus halalkaliphilus]